jgi:hypothetical protein
MNWDKFRDWMMLGLLTVGVYIFGDLNKNVQSLNVTMAIVTEKVMHHEKRIDKHEGDLDKLKIIYKKE